MTSVADVVFDAPVDQPFTYRVPPEVTVRPGQRVAAPLGGAERVGLVLAVCDEAAPSARLRPISRIVDATPLLGSSALELVRWIAAQSLTSLGSTALSLLPPPADVAGETPPPGVVGSPHSPLVLSGSGRERRLLELIGGAGAALVVTADIESAGRWAQRLEKLEPVARLDYAVGDAERAASWEALAAGHMRLGVGTRSALLAPLPSGALAALVDEHEPGHKPPGPPRLHSRDVLLERGAREGLRVVQTSATPSVEMWARCQSKAATLGSLARGRWPAITIADPRGIARREALTPPLARAMREALGAGRRVFLGVSRQSSALGCDECGAIVSCERCGIAFAWSAARRSLTCWLCGISRPPMETCPECAGRRLAAFGWGIERVEQSVRRRFPSARVARYEPDARRGRSGHAAGSRHLLRSRAEVPCRARLSALPAARLHHRSPARQCRRWRAHRQDRRGPHRIRGPCRLPGHGAAGPAGSPHRRQGRSGSSGDAGGRAGRSPGRPKTAPWYHGCGGRPGRMAVLNVRKYGDPVLRRRALEVTDVTAELRKTIADMVETMYEEVGIGLAAPQVGISLRLMVVGHEEGREPRALINPVIVARGGEVTAEEGCLSIPGIFAPVTRSEWVDLEAADVDGQPVKMRGRGLLARVFQHEMDHLDGVLFIDHLDPVTRDRIKRRIKKEGFPEDAPHRAFAL